MRLSILFASALATSMLAVPAARACDPVVMTCFPAVVVFPAYTAEGYRVGTVEARLRRPPLLERSSVTGQPLTVVFNTPARLPGAVDPDLELVPLPAVPHAKTRAVYPRGY